MQVHLRLYGVFRSVASSLTVEIPENAPTVKSAIDWIFAQGEFGALRSLLINSATSDPRPNALIMVSGREINTLKGLETELTEGDELALLPVAHGG